MRSKKIAVIYLGHRGAGPIFTLKLTEALSKKANVRAFLSLEISNIGMWKEKGLDALFFRVPHTFKEFLNPVQLFNCMKAIHDEIEKFNPDACLFTMIHPLNFLIQSLLKRRNVIILSVIHDPKPHIGEKIWVRVIQRLELKHPDAFIVLSDYSANILRRMVKKIVFRCDHPLMILEEFEEAQNLKQQILQVSREKFVFLNFGRIEPYKGIEIIVEAFHNLVERYPDVFLIVAGQGNLGYKATQKLKELESKGQAMFINRFLKDSEIRTLIDLSKVVVLPYLNATQSGIVSTVIYYGKPLIVTPVGALLEQTKYGLGALVVPPNDVTSLCCAMEIILKENVYKTICEEVNVLKTSTVTWEEFADRILGAVEHLS